LALKPIYFSFAPVKPFTCRSELARIDGFPALALPDTPLATSLFRENSSLFSTKTGNEQNLG
jgi:hypothetical protein